MENSTIIITLTGILAGLIHVLSGPDHLAAIAPLTANRPKKSWKIGFWWGMGHTSSVWLIAILVFLLKGLIPLSGLSHWSEKIVGFVLIGLGIWGLQKAFGSKLHYHTHDGSTHAHLHSHEINEPHNIEGHQHTSAPLGIGMIHGFAGSSHLIAIIPALALPGKYNALGYVLGFGIGTVLAMIGFSTLIGFFMQNFVSGFWKTYRWIQFGFASFAIGVGIFWLINN